MKVGDSILFNDGSGPRRRRFTIQAIRKNWVILVAASGEELLAKRDEVERQVPQPKSTTTGVNLRKSNSVYMVFVPDGWTGRLPPLTPEEFLTPHTRHFPGPLY